MKTFAHSLMDALTTHNTVIYWTTIAVCVVIVGLFALWGHRSRETVLARYEGEEPLAFWEVLALVYGPRIIAGVVTAILVMGAVSLPYIIIRQFV